MAAAEDALQRVGLATKCDQVVSTLSGGQQRRVALAQALVVPARVLLLDEPTAGLDPAQRTRFRQIISELPDDLPVIVSTHQVDDLDEVFHRVVVLAQGRVRFEGTTSEFMSLSTRESARPAEAAYLALLGAEV
jgi:ABC-2 type transport system ATP-binding protein